MRVLFLTHVLPYPLDAGPKVRAYFTLRRLALNNEVTLISFTRQGDPRDAVKHLETICSAVHTVPLHRSTRSDVWNLLKSQMSARPFLVARDWYPRMAELIRGLVASEEPFDAVHSDQLAMAPYALFTRDILKPRRPLTVLDEHNAVFKIPARMSETESNPLKRVALKREARKLASYEARTCAEFDEVVFVSEEDRASVEAQCPNEVMRTRSKVIPIAVQPSETVAGRGAGPTPRVTFVGPLHWPPNSQGVSWFAKQVWPTVHSAVPAAVFTVIGANPPAEIQSLRGESVQIKGHVADIDSYLDESRVFVVPLLAGGGVRVKILECWSKCIPAVSTSIGAEGLHAVNGQNILLADTAKEFARQVIRLLTEPPLATRIAVQGQRTIATYYDWRKAYHSWDEVYRCASFS